MYEINIDINVKNVLVRVLKYNPVLIQGDTCVISDRQHLCEIMEEIEIEISLNSPDYKLIIVEALRKFVNKCCMLFNDLCDWDPKTTG
jgi:hypothetical protein